MLDGAQAGLESFADENFALFDYSNRAGAAYDGSPGNFDPTNPWPAISPTGSDGGTRFRGYINLQCGDPLNVTVGLMGNDALALYIEEDYIVGVNWDDGQWKKFRYLSFPGPGLYAFEVQWSTNFTFTIDPAELVWADGFLTGYDNLDTICDYGTCTYNNGEAIPDFQVYGGDMLVAATDGGLTSCAQCAVDLDCAVGEVCNSAGICL